LENGDENTLKAVTGLLPTTTSGCDINRGDAEYPQVNIYCKNGTEIPPETVVKLACRLPLSQLELTSLPLLVELPRINDSLLKIPDMLLWNNSNAVELLVLVW